MPRLFIFLLFASFLYSCSKQDPVLIGHSLPLATYKGLYVDGFDQILGDSAKETSLLKWASAQGFNNLSLYGLGHILEDSKKEIALQNFISKARLNYQIVGVAACYSSADKFSNDVANYNATASTFGAFNTINLELEWWNNACSYSQYRNELLACKNWASKQFPKVLTETYIGWFFNPEGIEEQMASELILNCDRILIHDYENIPSAQYMLSRLKYLAQAAKASKKITEIVFIFNAEAQFSSAYFASNTFANAYYKVLQELSKQNLDGKEYLKFTGYQLFAYTDAQKIKPLFMQKYVSLQ